MGKTTIEWTDASWNPIVGCTEVSPGCANCYAARLAATRLRNTHQYKGLAHIGARIGAQSECERDPLRVPEAPRWTGGVRFLPERLEEPLHWRKPRKVFVCDMGDLFHESVTDEQISKVWLTMFLATQHPFQVLTKRPARMQAWVSEQWKYCQLPQTPLPNVVCMTSVENQHFANRRIPWLLGTPAAVRGISVEPMLGPIDLTNVPVEKEDGGFGERYNALTGQWWDHTGFEQTINENNPNGFPRFKLDWVICGGESGPNARPMHPDWARSLRDQCQAAKTGLPGLRQGEPGRSVPFFFKQWGEWAAGKDAEQAHQFALRNRGCCSVASSPLVLWKVGKKKACRLFDFGEGNA